MELEDQNLEIEALQAIYMNDFTMLDEDPKKFQILLVPNPGSEIGNHVGLTLEVSFPSKYPNILPEFKLKSLFGIDTDQQSTLESKLKIQSEESVGSPMIFNLAQTCKEWLDDNNIDRQELQRLKKVKAEEEKERKRAEGTAVTRESFTAWAKRFYAEKILEEKRIEAEKKKRLTGRALFENYADLISSDTKFVEEEEGEDAGEAVTVDWNLFRQELEDVELEDELKEASSSGKTEE